MRSVPVRFASPLAAAQREPGLALVRTGLAVALAAVPAAFWPGLYDDFTLPKQALLLVSAALVILGLAIDGDALPRSPWLRWALGAWACAITVSFVLGIDPRGSVLGRYQYRQGYLTNLTYVVLFLGAIRASRERFPRGALLAGMVGFAACALYSIIQAMGADPVNWWIDTADRAIGTIGNANELAAYAVVATGVAGAFATRLRGRRGLLAGALSAAAGMFMVLEAQSRSGIGAMVAVAVALPVAGLWLRLSRRMIVTQQGVLLGGLLAGAVLSWLAGGLEGSAGRVQSGIEGADPGGNTRLALWTGTLDTIRDRPLVGWGPDSLWLTFPRHRREDLGGAYETYDLVAQSAHNWLLDTAANTGLLGLAALVSLLLAATLPAIRASRRAAEDERLTAAWLWSAIAAYGAITLLNPLSLSAHSTFIVLLGILAGRADRLLPVAAADAQIAAPARIAAAVPVAAAALALAALLPVADHIADSAWAAYASNRFEDAARGYRHASQLVPLERQYAAAEPRTYLAQGAVTHDAAALAHAERSYQRLDDEFGFESADAFGLAAALVGMGRPAAEVDGAVAKAVALNPFGYATPEYAETVRSAARLGGRLVYEDPNHWVLVEPAADAHR